MPSGYREAGREPRIQQALLWLRRARLDHAALVRLLAADYSRKRHYVPSDPALAIYLLQQTVEKSAKALMVAAGEDEERIRKEYGHRSLLLILDFLSAPLNVTVFRDAINILSETPSFSLPDVSEAIRAIGDLKERSVKRSEEGFLSEFATWPPEVIKTFSTMLLTIRKEFLKKVKRYLPPNATIEVDPKGVSGGSIDAWLEKAAGSLRADPLPKDQMSAITQIINLALSEIHPNLHEVLSTEGPQRVRIRRDRFLASYILPLWAQISLYLLAAMTFPHEASTRYPAPLGAPEDPLIAAREGKLGWQHYTPSLGIVEHLPSVVYLTQLTLNDLGPAIQSTAEFWELIAIHEN